MLSGLIAAGIVVAVAASGQVQAPPPSSAQQALGGSPVPLPYSRVFSLPPIQGGPGAPRFRFEMPRSRATREKVVCGMTLIIVGSEADRSMVKPKPTEGVVYAMRRYPPPACAGDTARSPR